MRLKVCVCSLAFTISLGASGCTKAPEPRPPRKELVSAEPKLPPGPVSKEQWQDAREDLFKRRQQVESLYLTEDGRQITAVGIARAIVDPGTSELAWKAWQCNNPDCPGRQSDGSPLLFPWPDHLLFAKDDGTVGMRQPSTEEDFRKDDEYGQQKCPECLKLRVLAAETDEQRQQYQRWCQEHILPATSERLQQLDAERRALMKRKPSR